MDEINRKWAELNDAICKFERDSGRGYFCILIPVNLDEDVKISIDGKRSLINDPHKLIEFAMERRAESRGEVVRLTEIGAKRREE
jgi:hypothetical protein